MRGRRQAIYFSMGGWCGKFSNYMVVGVESFQIIWVVGVLPNLITWQIPDILDDIRLCARLLIYSFAKLKK